ncbi:hypothetical protein BCR33DRAFT_296467 [Rhizoclosmatium globosum]|uniref:Uncharacterized protein n=1 Tax=Rhizoclosmatium globosum TaxID=329046 RepID=A0A1Y2C6J2_9FUNG|nr:hypothetical protein BCR33DRAFT_296467 [Rhizoclosmatium globosum]|eukprot:ORY42504.1 hypothetical protein BCR33DRAFT_296467 [Rhizoclosmatium globosum]
MIAIEEHVKSVSKHDADNNMEGKTEFSIVPQLYKCPQGMVDGLDHCSCFTGDWSYSVNQATFDVLQESHDASVFSLGADLNQLRQELVLRRHTIVPNVVFVLSLNWYLFCPKLLLDLGVCAKPVFGIKIVNVYAIHKAMYKITLALLAKAGTPTSVEEEGDVNGDGGLVVSPVQGPTEGPVQGSVQVPVQGGAKPAPKKYSVLGGSSCDESADSNIEKWPEQPLLGLWKKEHYVLLDKLQNVDN